MAAAATAVMGVPEQSTSTTPSRAGAGGAGTAPKDENGERLPMPSRNPLPLSASQEAQVREVFNARVRSLCADEIKAFADCARSRTLTIAFACRASGRAMNSCMASHATAAEHDAAREEWFAQRMMRARERERKERRKMEQEKFHREWWGLPERDPELVRRELEKLQRAERVGGFRPREEGGGGGGGSESGSGSGSGRR